MQVSVEKKEGIYCSLQIEVPASDIDNEVAKRMTNIAKTAKIDGFRPGKVPIGMLKKKYGLQVRYEVISDLIPKNYMKAIQDEKLNAIDVEVEVKQDGEGQNLIFTANVETFPEFTVKGFDAIEIEKPTVNLGDKEVDKMIVNLKKQFATYEDVDRKSKNDDKVTINFIGRVSGEEFDGGKADGVEVLIGSGQMISDFETGLIGLEKNKMSTIAVNFPDDYGNEELKGKSAEFDVTITSIKEPILPVMDDEFANKLGVKGGIATFNEEIKQNMERELKAAIQRKIKEQVFTGLIKNNEFEVPKSLIKKDIQSSKQNFIDRSGDEAKNIKLSDIPDDIFEKSSSDRVKIGLTVNKLVDQEKFEVDDAALNLLIDEMASVYEDANEYKAHVKKNEEELNNIKAIAIENKLVDWVVSHAKVTEKEHDFFDLIREAMQQQNMA